MKKIFSAVIFTALVAMGIFAFQDDNIARAYFKGSIGTYQCSICGEVERISTPNTVLGDYALDGHKHDWHYIGGLSGTLHYIK